jgi:cold shock CspA family protein
MFRQELSLSALPCEPAQRRHAGELGTVILLRTILITKVNYARMTTGTLKMWNSECGFIADDAGIFLQVSALLSAGIDPDNVKNGDRLTFDVESSPQGKTRACNVRRPG